MHLYTKSPPEEFSSGLDLSLFLVALAFVLGGFLGGSLAAYTASDGSDALRAYLEQFLSVAGTGTLVRPERLGTVWSMARWPLLIFLLGNTVFPAAALLLLSGARGLLFSFSAVAFAQTLGRQGTLLSLCLSGVPACFYLPVFFFLTARFLHAGAVKQAEGRTGPVFPGELGLSQLALCGGVLLAGMAVECYVLPQLLAQLNF